ncbi:MAG: hypothetical protein JXR07_17210 [Reichenbachiella sp.]
MKKSIYHLSFLLSMVALLASCSEDEPLSPPDGNFEFSISEDLRGGEEIGDISVEDPDGLSLTYILNENPASALFEVDESSGIIRVGNDVILAVDGDTVFDVSVAVSNGSSSNDGMISISIEVTNVPFSFNKYDDIQPIESRSVGLNGWEEYDFSLDDCRCFNGDSFKVAALDNNSSSNLIITLQGGGACWDGINFNCEDQYTSVLSDYLSVADFSLELANRIEGDWNHVMIPYCDKSLYSGDYSIDYNGADGENEYFWGFRNGSAGINLAADKFPNVERIILTGCSAGGYGTIFNSAFIRHQFPQAEILVINESGAGLLHPTSPNIWETVLGQWNLNETIDANCESCDAQVIHWYDDILSTDDNIRIAQFSSYEDFIIRIFLGGLSSTVFKNHLLAETENLHNKYPNKYKRFFIEGDSHCFGSLSARNYAVNEQSYWDWVIDFVNNDPGWVDILE